MNTSFSKELDACLEMESLIDSKRKELHGIKPKMDNKEMISILCDIQVRVMSSKTQPEYIGLPRDDAVKIVVDIGRVRDALLNRNNPKGRREDENTERIRGD